ncbi:sulfite oxidase heme-binding subunit YedZ [Silvibacterium dinghuense]|uniref:Protein-methionine-sulfoxide reductase heme-binding subunit MsrQ n=1 Tax=Silvibacterium dinghuense TaxID=1560006 RepID=A0A4Q1SHG1_9BACT|nr:protein-methionine-sulfoxide reductase heme-binding subunit MsrQ [Silvibacterium dinghuense]RXS96994.1 sulfoxide reductase heme-binding subunit YedZ [Silvibacterium dinghuense]GGG95316.1 protein-methionine-sulfoxide reductase heme-binding subunit MsrQ [Silvibacterium dinghuense]
MSNRTLKVLKILSHLACAAPLVWLLWLAIENHLGPDPTHTVTFFTGKGTLRLLVLSLAVTPVRRLSPRLSWLIRFRRMLGLWAFAYGCLHLLTYIALYAGFSVDAMLDDLSRRRFIFAGMASWALMVPLALTSTAWSIRKLGGKAWNRLHRLAYLSAIAGVVHYWWGVKQGVHSPFAITLTLAVLLIVRPLWGFFHAMGKAQSPSDAMKRTL